MEIHRATDADAEAISALNRDIQALHAAALPHLFKPPAPDSFPPDKVRSLLQYPQVRMWIGSVGGDPAGYVYAEIVRQGESALRLALDYVYVHHLAVVPARQRHGYGTRLLRTVTDHARSEGVSALHLDVWAFNAQAQGFFAKHGFLPFNMRMSRNIESQEE
jgi:ribosomal protein S18 acetylase RimI-like enzyme